MTKHELGQKHFCTNCGAKFYDLTRSPPTCPKCETVVEVVERELAAIKAIEADKETMEEVSLQVPELEKRIKKLSLDIMLDDPDDPNNAIVSIDFLLYADRLLPIFK